MNKQKLWIAWGMFSMAGIISSIAGFPEYRTTQLAIAGAIMGFMAWASYN